MYKHLIIFLCIVSIILCYPIGYSGLINIGPKYSTVGINTLNTTYNVVDPTNTTHVFIILQTAFNDTSLNGGGTIYITEGIYMIETNLEIYGNMTHIQGAGINKTIIKLSDFAPSYVIDNGKEAGLIRGYRINNIVISNLTLNGNKYNQLTDKNSTYGRYGIFTEGCSNVWFDNIEINNCQAYGFDPHGIKIDNTWGEYLTISNCISANNNWDGFTIDQTFHVFIINCTAVNNGRHGFNIVTGSKFVTIVNSTVLNNGFNDKLLNGTGGCGFMVQNNFFFNTSDVTMNNNYAFENYKAGVCINDVYNINITNNLIEDDDICLNKTNNLDYSTYTCFSLINVDTIIISQNNCTSFKFLEIYNSTLINNEPTNNITFVYSYNNTFSQIPVCTSIISSTLHIQTLSSVHNNTSSVIFSKIYYLIIGILLLFF